MKKKKSFHPISITLIHMGQASRAKDDAYTVAIAKQLQAVRTLMGVSQQDLADGAGIPRSTVAKILAGTHAIDISQLRALCQAFDISMSTLLLEVEIQLDDRASAAASVSDACSSPAGLTSSTKATRLSA